MRSINISVIWQGVLPDEPSGKTFYLLAELNRKLTFFVEKAVNKNHADHCNAFLIR